MRNSRRDAHNGRKRIAAGSGYRSGTHTHGGTALAIAMPRLFRSAMGRMPADAVTPGAPEPRPMRGLSSFRGSLFQLSHFSTFMQKIRNDSGQIC
jgi:hypothetical protein